MGKRRRCSVKTGGGKENVVEGIFTVLTENWTVVTQAVFCPAKKENGKAEYHLSQYFMRN